LDARSDRSAVKGAFQQDFIVTKIESQHGSSNLASEMARRIQSTLVSNCVTRAMWQKHIDDCLTYHFHAAMIPPSWVHETARALRGSGIRVASFIDLPLGTMTSRGKAYEAAKLVQDGVDEIDLMPNVGFLVSGMEKEYFDDIRAVVDAAGTVPVKIMLELPLLNESQRELAVRLSIDAGVAYLKNASSGAVGEASVEQIHWLRQHAPEQIRIKASGGIKTAQHVRELLDAGADLVGTSAGTQIMLEIEGDTPAIGNPALEY
jgi:deoxyribose-phosphate aldolase